MARLNLLAVHSSDYFGGDFVDFCSFSDSVVGGVILVSFLTRAKNARGKNCNLFEVTPAPGLLEGSWFHAMDAPGEARANFILRKESIEPFRLVRPFLRMVRQNAIT